MQMQKNIVQLEVQIDQKVCRFLCDGDTPTHFIKEALFQFTKYVGSVEDAAKERARQEQEMAEVMTEAEPIEEICPTNFHESSVS